MCGRFSLGVTALAGRGDAGELEALREGVYRAQIAGSEDTYPATRNVEIDTRNIDNFHPSYNVGPTNSALIIYMVAAPQGTDAKYVIESLLFGMIPAWAKPSDPTAVRNDDGIPYSKEIQKYQARYFNCRKESLADNLPIWNSCKKTHRCVVPIQGYFEWHKSKTDKVPHFVHSAQKPLVYLAGLYSHNTNYTDNYNVKDKFLSSFTIVTAPALSTDKHDISWLHSRKPMFLKPHTKEWDDWLNPSKTWTESMLDTCLNSTSNDAFADLEIYPVTKEVGKPGNKGLEMLERVKMSPQKSITLFFGSPGGSPKRRKGNDSKPVELFSDTKTEAKEKLDPYIKLETSDLTQPEIKKEITSSGATNSDTESNTKKASTKRETTESPKKNIQLRKPARKPPGVKPITSFFKKIE